MKGKENNSDFRKRRKGNTELAKEKKAGSFVWRNQRLSDTQDRNGRERLQGE